MLSSRSCCLVQASIPTRHATSRPSSARAMPPYLHTTTKHHCKTQRYFKHGWSVFNFKGIVSQWILVKWLSSRSLVPPTVTRIQVFLIRSLNLPIESLGFSHPTMSNYIITITEHYYIIWRYLQHSDLIRNFDDVSANELFSSAYDRQLHPLCV